MCPGGLPEIPGGGHSRGHLLTPKARAIDRAHGDGSTQSAHAFASAPVASKFTVLRSRSLRIAIAQFNAILGDLAENSRKILALAHQAAAAGADVLVTPELALCAYPPEDLLLRPDFYAASALALAELAQNLPPALTVIVGHPCERNGQRFNTASVLRGGQCLASYDKNCLPNNQVFDEVRYFTPGNAPCVVEIAGVRCGINICEDVWQESPVAAAKAGQHQSGLELGFSERCIIGRATVPCAERAGSMFTRMPDVGGGHIHRRHARRS